MAQGPQTLEQRIGVTPQDITSLQNRWIVAGKVKTVTGYPVKGAAVTISPLSTTATRLLATDVDGEFNYQFGMLAEEVREFKALLTVKKKGFETEHAYVNYGKSARTWWIPFTLHEEGDDANRDLLSAADLIAGVAPKLRQLGPANGLSSKSEKDYTRGVTAFLDQQNPQRAVPILADVSENNPTCIGCQTMLGLAELDWDAWDNAKESFINGVNAAMTNRTMGGAEPFVVYGTWLNWQHDPVKAEPFFLEALKSSPQDALALQELGRTLLIQQEFGAASEYLKKSLAAGAGPEGRLLYIRACVGAGRVDEANAEMARYLAGRDIKKMPLPVREVWASVQDRNKLVATYAAEKWKKDHAHFDFLQNPPADLIQGLEPAKDQVQLPSILDAAGAKILEMTRNFPNTTSLEAIHQQRLGKKGEVRSSQNQKFRYLCMLPSRAWGPAFKEYRADSSGKETEPKGIADGFMLTGGFTSAALIFHPTYRSESDFRYLGRQKINGQEMFVVAYAQIPGKAHLYGNFQAGQTSLPTYSQGLAWIDTSSYRIVRLHTDLLRPLPELRLKREAMNIDFDEVHFKHHPDTLWLPEQVTVTIDWNGKTLRNTHAYSDFKIFNVGSSERIGKPKVAAVSSKSTVTP
jgi:Tfp pilus assembly protein PilF